MSKANELREMFLKAGGPDWDWSKHPRMALPVKRPMSFRHMMTEDPMFGQLDTKVEFELLRRQWMVVNARGKAVTAGSAPATRTYEAEVVVCDGLIIDAKFYDPEQRSWIPMPEQVGMEAPK